MIQSHLYTYIHVGGRKDYPSEAKHDQEMSEN
jgi:hypothetical protein